MSGFLGILSQASTNPGHEVALVTKFFRLAPNVCGFSVWNLLTVTLLVVGILSWLLDI
jgi:hypothetical protein